MVHRKVADLAEYGAAGCAHSRLDDVIAGAHSRVEHDRNVTGRIDDTVQHVQRADSAVGPAATVRRAVDRVHPAVDRAANIVWMADPLENQRERGQRAQAAEVGPGERWLGSRIIPSNAERPREDRPRAISPAADETPRLKV